MSATCRAALQIVALSATAPRSAHHPAAARMEDLAGEVARVVRGEGHRADGHVLHAAEAAEGQLGEAAGAVLVGHHPAAHVRLDAAGGDGVHGDAVPADL